MIAFNTPNGRAPKITPNAEATLMQERIKTEISDLQQQALMLQKKLMNQELHQAALIVQTQIEQMGNMPTKSALEQVVKFALENLHDE